MSALGVMGGFMYPSGLSNVIITGRTYHRLLEPNSGDHSLRWFLHDGAGHEQAAQNHQIPLQWVSIIKEGLLQHNPYVQQLRTAMTMLGPQAEFQLDLSPLNNSLEMAAVINTTNF